jgi:glucosyl-dolichyl phosphate glucuronosyltransferase
VTTWSVVIACHTQERWESLNAAIDSASGQTVPPPEVIVVVDYNPALLDRVQAELGDRVFSIPNQEAKGLSGCRNTGAAVASGEYVAFLDDDARADTGWLASMEKTLDRPDVIGVGGLAVPEWESGTKPAWMPEEFLWVVGCHYRGHRQDAGPIRSPIGANMAFARSDIFESGGFSHVFSTEPFNRCDDTEFAIRAKNRSGREVHFVPDAVVHHRVTKERTTWGYFARRCLLEGRAKAALSSITGVSSTTATERSYVRNTIGPGTFRHLRRGIRGNFADFAVAMNLVVGLFITSIGFAQGKLILGRTQKTTMPEGPSFSRSK